MSAEISGKGGHPISRCFQGDERGKERSGWHRCLRRAKPDGGREKRGNKENLSFCRIKRWKKREKGPAAFVSVRRRFVGRGRGKRKRNRLVGADRCREGKEEV